MPAATVLSSVTTAAVEVRDRLAYWEHHNADALVGLTCSTYQPEGLVARELNLDVGDVRVADISGNAHVIERAPAMVRAHPKDAVFLSLLMAGEAFFHHPGGWQPLTAGDLLVYETDSPYLFGFPMQMRQVIVDVPRELFRERCGAVDLRTPLHVAGDVPGVRGASARALREALLGLVADPAVAQDGVGDQLLDLVQIITSGQQAPGSVPRLLEARAWIADHLQDPGLCTDSVARALGVTPRHLNRAFAVEGTTVARYIKVRRLERARADLGAASMGDHRIVDIASRWGFASQSHFTQLYRAHFGRTPSQDRGARPGQDDGGG